ncbi:hypothetical protein [Candidatus Enterococcus ferrettii]|uniref:Uncharacterized protein n=1 Tax=Candidatus Enterococcus ferrettii TaxID=2815324 RepID=A0ABV0ENV6_9ENTE|nr:hypothetical protein [Enterococcus sp. 665A]MBO1341242.1 hypothetical protein [Enterococcus sp. 665A]
MKRIAKIRFLLSKNKQIKRTFVFICFVTLMLGGVFTGVKIVNEKERVSAHPMNPITISDEDGNFPFDVPIDGSAVSENALTAQTPRFDNYLQNDGVIPILEKRIVEGTAGSSTLGENPVTAEIRAIERTNFGNFFVLYGFGGAGSGGVAKVAVFNRDGECLAENLAGTFGNSNLRVNTGFYNMANNSFLVGTHNGSFFRYEVSDESNAAATIICRDLDVTGNPNTNMSADMHRKVDTFSDYSNDSMIVGRINTSNVIFEGRVKGRIPISTVNVSDWEDDGFSGESTYAYSIENLLHTDEEIGLTGIGESVYTSPEDIYFNSRSDKLYGTFYNQQYNNGRPSSVNSFQVFDTTENVPGQDLRKRKFAYITRSQMLVLKEICTDTRAYFISLDADFSRLIEVNLDTYTQTTIKTYPRQTRIKMLDNGDGTISYYGSTTELTGDFYSDYYSNSLEGNNFFVSGVMKDFSDADPLGTISVRALVTDGYVSPTTIIDSGNNQLFMGGTTTDSGEFVDTVKYYTGATTPPSEIGTPSATIAYVGLLEIQDDYSPAISVEGDIDIDISQSSVASPSVTDYFNWNTLDRWLITGSENGEVGDNSAVKVYDQMDSNDTSLGATPQERERALQLRINRNPLNSDAEIDWLALGFDRTKSGAQQVTYFVTDSQGQPSVTSRWVNKKTNQTIERADYCLDAQNFHVPLNGVDTTIPDADTFKELAKTMAWNSANHTAGSGDQGEGLDEDGTDSSKLSSKVTVDADQLRALREATVARPYPVDVTYEPESGIELTNRVWVFVTTKNTVPNSETNPAVTPADTNGVVYYADDYSLPFRMRADHDADDVLERGNVRVYDYFDSTHETSAELPVLADKDTNSAHLQVINLDRIHHAFEPGTIEYGPSPKEPLIQYEWQGGVDGNHQSGVDNPAFGGLDVTLAGDVLLHVRQVVLEPEDQLVNPEEGYLNLKTSLYDPNSNTHSADPSQLVQIQLPSQNTEDVPDFKTFVVSTNHMMEWQDQLSLNLILPEFYECIGNFWTPRHLGDPNDPMGADHQDRTENDIYGGTIEISKRGLDMDGEYFITLYIKPTTGGRTPQPYSWDYKKNDLGRITIR